MPRRPILLLCLTAALACGGRGEPVPPPDAEFLVEAGDSTYWVRSGADGMRVRSSPMLLARYDGRFYEVYVADDDYSYYDAILVGQRLFRRDILTGDSAVVFDDPAVPRIARHYASEHPGDLPLAPDEEASDDPATTATGEIEVLDLHGPYVSFEYHSDVEIDGGEDRHMTRRGVIDLRTGSETTVAAIFGDTASSRIIERGRRLFLAALDSVLAARDTRALRAVDALGELEFDETSFSLAEQGGAPAVVFAASARGDRAGGLVLPLDAIPAPTGEWWSAVRAELPLASADSSEDSWRRGSLSVLARYDSAGKALSLALRDDAGQQWPVGPAPAPARRLLWLDDPPVDSTTRRALLRAFDESTLYSEKARVAKNEPRSSTRPVTWRAPKAARPASPRARSAS